MDGVLHVNVTYFIVKLYIIMFICLSEYSRVTDMFYKKCRYKMK